MKYKHIQIERPEKFAFVRGASVQEALFFLDRGYQGLGEDNFVSPWVFSVFARPDFTRNRDYSTAFEANIETKILDKAKEYAEIKGQAQYFRNQTINADCFDNYYSPEVSSTGIYPEKNVLFDYIDSKECKGVNLYFNKKLMQHTIWPDADKEMHREYNGLRIAAWKPIQLNSLVAIEANGDYEYEQLERLIEAKRK